MFSHCSPFINDCMFCFELSLDDPHPHHLRQHCRHHRHHHHPHQHRRVYDIYKNV